jgi:hypothetical protein
MDLLVSHDSRTGIRGSLTGYAFATPQAPRTFLRFNDVTHVPVVFARQRFMTPCNRTLSSMQKWDLVLQLSLICFATIPSVLSLSRWKT